MVGFFSRLGAILSKLELVQPTTPTPKPDDHLLTMDEVATMLGVSISFVKNHSTRVKPFIPSVKWGDEGTRSTRRYRKADIMKFIEDHLENRPRKTA
jgi:predicted DNA-binding transcriptional regulator AlpA